MTIERLLEALAQEQALDRVQRASLRISGSICASGSSLSAASSRAKRYGRVSSSVDQLRILPPDFLAPAACIVPRTIPK